MLVVEFRGGLEEPRKRLAPCCLRHGPPTSVPYIRILHMPTRLPLEAGITKPTFRRRTGALLGYDLSSLPVNISGLRSYLHLGYEYNTGENENAVTSVSPYVVTKPWTSTDTWSSFGDGGHESSSPYSVSIAGPDNEDTNPIIWKPRTWFRPGIPEPRTTTGSFSSRATTSTPGASVVKEFAPVGFGRLEPFLAVFYDWTEPLSVEGVSMKSFQGNINPFTKSPSASTAGSIRRPWPGTWC